MGELEKGKRSNYLVCICLMILLVGPYVLFFGIQVGTRLFRVESEPHPLEQIPPADVIPDCYNGTTDVDNLSILVTFSMGTYSLHSGAKGTFVDFKSTIVNNGNITIDDLHFWRMTIYWINFSANFTTGFTPSENYTIESNATLSIELEGSHDWTGIPYDLCWSQQYVYGRVFVSFNSNVTHILTTGIKLVRNLVE